MKKKLSKNYPKFDEQVVIGPPRASNHWCDLDKLPQIPNRFGDVYFLKSIGSSAENFVSFGCEVSLPEDQRRTTQDGMFMYREPIVLSSRDQLKGNLPDGDVDFYVDWKCFSLENGGTLTDPNTRYGVRYPYKVATYYPIRNALLIKNFTHGEPTPSVKHLVAWILQKVETIGYKYSKHGALLIGSDPEFLICDIMDERISADRIFPDPDRCNPVGTDGSSSTGELRPAPEDCPLKHVNNIKKLMEEVARKLGNDKKILTGCDDNLPSIGNHIHFNKMPSSEEIELLDVFVGEPALKIKGVKRSSGSGFGEKIRRQPHGAEYRVPGSSLIPELSAALYVTAFCCLMKWETLEEGETFEFETDDRTGIPILEAYRALDITRNKKYTPHLEEYWKWVTHVDGREIDPRRDCLHFWIDGRKEVKPYPGIKVSWSSNIFPKTAKEKFIEIETMDKIYDISVFTLPPSEQDEEKVLQICMPDSEKKKIRMADLRSLKTKYDISGILGFDHSTKKLGLSQALLDDIRTMRKLKSMVIAFAKVICI